MKIIKNIFLCLVVGGAVAIAATASQAAIYNFTFSNTAGATAGTVTGSITLADGNGERAATSIIITDSPYFSDLDPAFDFLAATNTINYNSFKVSGGHITSSEFWAKNLANTYFLIFGNADAALLFEGSNRTIDVWQTTDGPEFSVSVVPLPAAFPLYGAGIAVMGFIGWRRKRKAAATV